MDCHFFIIVEYDKRKLTVKTRKISSLGSVATWRHFISWSIPRKWQLLQTKPLYPFIPEDFPRRLGNLLLSLTILNENNHEKTLKRSGCRHWSVVCWWACTALQDFCRNRQYFAVFSPDKLDLVPQVPGLLMEKSVHWCEVFVYIDVSPRSSWYQANAVNTTQHLLSTHSESHFSSSVDKTWPVLALAFQL